MNKDVALGITIATLVVLTRVNRRQNRRIRRLETLVLFHANKLDQAGVPITEADRLFINNI